MRGIKFVLRFSALCLVLFGSIPSGRAIASGSTSCGCTDPCRCVPNATHFGYFEPGWRQWPQQKRSAETLFETPFIPEADPPADVQSILRQEAPDHVRPPVEPPAAEPPLPAEPPPALTPSPSDSGTTYQNGRFRPETAAKTWDAPIHPPTQTWNDPGNWAERFDRVNRSPVVAAEPTSYRDPIQPWAEPRNWQDPVGPIDEQAGRRVTQAAYQDYSPYPPNAPAVWQPETNRSEEPVAGPLDRPVKPADPSPGLNGYCPVELVENEKWVAGDPRWAIVHRNRTYLTSGPAQRQRFMANPERYAPVLSGNDPVWSVDRSRFVGGKTDFCVVYDGRLYMFAEAATLARFRQDPKHYAAAVQQAVY
jgi:YHS domain-containing protein